LLELTTDFPCYTCKHKLLMPDGRFWCGITLKTVIRYSFSICPIDSHEVGSGTVYKPEPRGELLKQETIKVKEVKPIVVKAREVKPIVVKANPVKSSKKKPPPQTRLF